MRQGKTSRPRDKERRRFIPKRKVCAFCVDRSRKLDYKEANQLRRFISDSGKIEPRHRTGVCAKHQRLLSIALKRARYLALLPYTADHIRWGGSIGLRDRA